MFLLSAALAVSMTVSGAEPELPVTRARADGKGHIAVHLVYFAEHTCMAIASVKEGHPPNIEAPKRTPTVTVVLDRNAKAACEQKLTKLEQTITIADRPNALSVEVLYVDKNNSFIRSSRPPISRPGQDEDEIQ